MCTPGVDVLQPGASTHEYAVHCNTGPSGGAAVNAGQGISDTPAVGVPQVASVSSSSSSPTLPWGTAEDSSPPFSPNCVQEGHSQDVPDEGSLFNVSPLSPGLFVRPPRGSGSPPAGGVILPTTLEDFDDSVLGDSITYTRCEQFPGSESPLSRRCCISMAAKFGLLWTRQ